MLQEKPELLYTAVPPSGSGPQTGILQADVSDPVVSPEWQ
jgi:hypothetical protein